MNAQKIWTAVAVAAAVALAIGGATYWWGSAHEAARADSAAIVRAPAPDSGARVADPTAPAAPAGTGNRRILYWQDPMTPGPRFDKPGKSPFMDMQLVPVYADEASATGGVSISARTVQNLGVRTAEVVQRDIGGALAVVGAVAIDERQAVVVQTRVAGYVERLYVRAQYDAVRAGAPLAEIYAPDWLAAEEEYLALKRSALPAANELAAAARQRLLLLGIPEAQVARLEREGRSNARVTLHAPRSGIVWEIGVREGQAVSPGMTLFRIGGLDTVWVNAEVPERDAALASPGTLVEARSAAAPSRVLKGRVSALLPDVNPTTRTIKARVELANPDGVLKPGMFAALTLAGRARSALVVPSESVIYTGRRNVVILAEGDGRFRPVDVTVDGESGDMTAITQGLETGQRVVVSGQFLIDSEASLKGALSRLNDPAIGASPAAGK